MSRFLRLYEKKRGDRRTGSSKLGSLGEALFFSVFLVIGLVAFTVMLRSMIWPELRANRHFVETRCTVISAQISETRNEDGPRYRPEITIEFDVAGKKQRTTTYDAARWYTSSRQEAEEARDEFKPGNEYTCWYDPAEPRTAVLVRGYSGWLYLLLLIPLSFVALGGGGLIYTLWHWGTSAERRSAIAQRAASLDLTKDPEDLREAYPQIPASADWKSSPGTNLAYRLPIATTPGWQLVASLVACLFWNGITSIFVFIAVSSHLRGDPEWFLTVFIIPFVLIGLGLLYYFIRQLLITTGIGPTRMEICRMPLHPGERCELFLSQSGRLSLNSLEVLLVCEEQATYRQGTDTRTEQKRVLEKSVFRRDNLEIEQQVPFEHQWEIQIPPGAMHSFHSTHNEINWKLIVKGDVAGWPNFTREYPVIMFPAHHQEAAHDSAAD